MTKAECILPKLQTIALITEDRKPHLIQPLPARDKIWLEFYDYANLLI